MGATFPPPPRPQDPEPAEPAPRRPNYGRRRLGLATAIVAAVGVIVGAIWMARQSSDGLDVGFDWDSIAVVDRDRGTVMLLDGGGEVVGEISSDVPRVTYISGEHAELAVVGASSVGVVAIPEGDANTPALPPGARPMRIASSGPLTFLAAPPSGGQASIVSGTWSIDVGEATGLDDPLFLGDSVRSDREATRFALADARSFQTVVVGPADTEAVFLPGLPLGVTNELAVTIQPAGERAELRFSSVDGERIGGFDVPNPVAGTVTPDGRVLLVTASGEVFAGESDDDDAERLGALTLGSEVVGGVPAQGGERFVVTSDRAIAVLDGSGRELATIVVDGPLVRRPLVGTPWQRCVLAITEDGSVTMVDLDSGDVLRAVDDVVSVGASSLDGCTAAVTRPDGFGLVRATEETRFDIDLSIAAISPDGGHVVGRDAAGRAWLRAVDGAGPGVELAVEGDTAFAFVDR